MPNRKIPSKNETAATINNMIVVIETTDMVASVISTVGFVDVEASVEPLRRPKSRSFRFFLYTVINLLFVYYYK